MKHFYLTVNPYALTNIETGKTNEYKNLDELLKATLSVSSKTYVYDLDKLARVFANKLLTTGYKNIQFHETSDGTMGGKIPSKSFLIVANKDTTSFLRVRKTQNIQVQFYNASKLFGGATVKDIVSSVGETEENIGMALAIKSLLEQGHTAWTLGGNAIRDLKKRCFENIGKNGRDYTNKLFRQWFPILEDDIHNFVMSSFQGGICYFNPKYANKEVKKGGVEYDVNSMYPSVMIQEELPWGCATRFEGKYQEDVFKTAYFQEVKIKKLKLKWKGVPCIKNRTGEGYYKEASDVTLVLNHIDMEMMFDNYKVKGIEYNGGYMFRTKKGLFDNYINYWSQKKIEAKTPYDRMIAKLMLNNAYGKFATRTDKKGIYYGQTTTGKTAVYTITDAKQGNSVYAPVGAYITSYARQRLIKAIKANGRKFVYSDTDSIYVIGNKVKGIEEHESKFGAWKKEFSWNKMNIIGKKQYVVEKEDKSIKVACAGMPMEVINKIEDYNDFALGKKFEYEVIGYDKEGVQITQTHTYELKDENIF